MGAMVMVIVSIGMLMAVAIAKSGFMPTVFNWGTSAPSGRVLP